MSERKQEVRDQISKTAGSISEIVRFIGIGYLILYFFSLTNSGAQALAEKYNVLVALVGASGIIAIFLDYINNVLRLKSSYDAYFDPDFDYQTKSRVYLWARRLFWLKQMFCIFGGFIIVYIFISINWAKILSAFKIICGIDP